MRVATWNINNVNKRLDLVLDWLKRTKPDVVALQELKAVTAAFPAEAFRKLGYESLVVGQRSWNGVALLGRGVELLPVLTRLPGDPEDKEARYLEAAIDGVLFASLYLPNGNPFPGPKFDYKLRWFERLRQRSLELWDSGQPVVLLGDWNVVPTDQDIYKPDTWRDNALLQAETRAAFSAILDQGWTDALKAKFPSGPPFSFWDYRRKRWERDAGLRIDHILLGNRLKLVDAGVDRDERGREDASDHAPVWAEIHVRKAAGRQVATRGKKTPSRNSEGPEGANGKSASPAVSPLAKYNAKRDFSKTVEPPGQVKPSRGTRRGVATDLQFVIQKHWASRLHYDLRLELDGVMVSWAVPKGPSYDPSIKQMAIHVEDHPIEYNAFEGSIPKGEYGGGKVIVWDRGTWEPQGDAREGLVKGKILFKLHGQKLAGLWELVRISKPGDKKQDQWMLFKKRGDAWARPGSDYNVITALPDSVVDQPLGLVEDREPREAAASGGHIAKAAATEIDLSAAVDAELPKALAPQLATLVASVPAGDWVVETKFDGYRLMCRVEGSDIRLFTRNGHDWTEKVPGVATAIAALKLSSAWLDGEIVVLNDAGVPDFNRLQNSMDAKSSSEVTMFLFDVPFLNGKDLRAAPVTARRAVLKSLMDSQSSDVIRMSESFDVDPAQLLGAACKMGLEGVMVKRADAPYSSGRTDSWMKLKCQHRQEFVIVGFNKRSGSAKEVGGLLLAYHDEGALRYAGSVGTGWGAETGRMLHDELSKIEIAKPAVDATSVKPGRWSKRTPGAERWVKPVQVVEVAFSEWTPDGHVRHPVFRGLRADKPASQITREREKAATGVAAKSTAAKTASSIKVTNPERVIDPSTGLRKVELVRYYESIAEWMLPHLRDRPVSLVRAPTGITGELFFQKHTESKMIGMTELDPLLWKGHAALLAVNSSEALIAAAQMNVVEFHTWNSVAKRIDQPDRFILDLDPGEGVTWPMLQEAAVLTRVLLNELGLESWIKTSGGKGLHVVVPITPKLDYTEVKAFSQAVVRHMAKVIPSKFVAVMGPSNRVGKIFIDYLRNGHGQTTACAFSARSRAGLGVSMPIDWEQLSDIKSGAQWTIATARDYLSFQDHDPWSGYWKKKQSLTSASKRLAK